MSDEPTRWMDDDRFDLFVLEIDEAIGADAIADAIEENCRQEHRYLDAQSKVRG